MIKFYEHSKEAGGQSMHNNMNRHQAKAFADFLLFMVVAIGLFAMVVYWPATRAAKDGIVQKQNFKKVFPFDFKFRNEEKLMRYLQASEIKR